MTLTPDDIRNPRRQSGFNYVTRAHSTGSRTPLWCARKGQFNKGTAATDWHGPCRKDPLEAAQDYCDYVNGSPSRMPKRLKTAGHKQRTPRTPRKGPTATEQRIAELEKELRGLKRQREKDSSGRQGYVYCIAEAAAPHEPTLVLTRKKEVVAALIGARGVKIGHAVDPHKRIAELQTGNPRKLILLGFIKGTMEDEAHLHQRFHKDNVLQEWFCPSRELLSLFVNKEG